MKNTKPHGTVAVKYNRDVGTAIYTVDAIGRTICVYSIDMLHPESMVDMVLDHPIEDYGQVVFEPVLGDVVLQDADVSCTVPDYESDLNKSAAVTRARTPGKPMGYFDYYLDHD